MSAEDSECRRPRLNIKQRRKINQTYLCVEIHVFSQMILGVRLFARHLLSVELNVSALYREVNLALLL